MPDKKVDAIFREGAGSHWDPEVTKAFFKAKPDIEEIRWHEKPPAEDGREQWV